MRIEPVFTVRCVSDSIAWYEELLGLGAVYINDPHGSRNYAVLRSGEAVIHLGLERDMNNAAGEGGCNIVTPEFERMLDRARRMAANFYIEPTRIPSGARTFGIRDPDGNLIAFIEAERESAP